MPIISFKGKILEKKQLSDDCIHMEFSCPDLEFKPGQFLNIATFKDEKKKWTPYSILTPPSHKGSFCIYFKVIPDGWCTPILNKAKVGDEFDFKGPLGGFYFNEDSKHKEHWFIGTGTGIAPLHSMIKEYKDKLKDHKFKLFYGVKTSKDLAYDEEFKSLDIEYVPICSREDWQGCKGHVQDHLGKELKNKDFYICGLKDMVLDTVKYLEDHGVKKEDIHFERYT